MQPLGSDNSHIALWGAVLGALGALAAVIVGFALNELSYWLRTRREDRRTIARALTELLEIRVHLRLVPVIVDLLRERLPVKMSPQDELMFRKFIELLAPRYEDVQKRYDDAVSSVSPTFPLLAYHLRSKDVMGPIIRKLRDMLPPDPRFADFWIKVEDEMFQYSIPILDDLILEMAKMQGRKTLRETRAIFERRFEMPPEFNEIFAQVIAQAKKEAEDQPDQRKSETQPEQRQT